jgi:hypothetical protein
MVPEETAVLPTPGPMETPEPGSTPAESTPPEATSEPPEPTPLVVSQGSLMADPGSPLAWILLTLFGIWFGRQLVFRVRVPAPRSRREARYHEPATRPHRG